MGVAADDAVVVRPIARCTAALLLLLSGVAMGTSLDAFSWLRPAISVDAAAQSRLDRGEVIVRVLPSADGELGVFAASRVNADPEMFVTWVNAIAQLKKSRFVIGVRRLSDPPAFEDLQDISLDDVDLEDLRRCRPGDCSVKLTIEDIEALRHAADVSGAEWKDAVQEQFRRVVWNRITSYQTSGFSGLQPYADRHRTVAPNSVFSVLVDHSPYLQSSAFAPADVESFFYWSKEQYGAGKAVIGLTHVDIVRPRLAGSMLVAAVSREVFATHYRNASLGLTALTEDASGHRYLVYVNRSQLDLLGGIFGPWKRSLLEGRLKSESAGVFSEIRRRIESGPPPE
jgi:hypothetical protein